MKFSSYIYVYNIEIVYYIQIDIRAKNDYLFIIQPQNINNNEQAINCLCFILNNKKIEKYYCFIFLEFIIN